MTCTYCSEPAYVKCRKHRQYLCGDTECTNLHRSAGGDCDFFEASQRRAFEPMDWVVAIGAAVVVVVGVAVVVAHL